MSEAKSFEEQMAGLGTAGEYLGKALELRCQCILFLKIAVPPTLVAQHNNPKRKLLIAFPPASNNIYFTATSIFTFKARIIAAMVSNRGFEPWRKAL